MPDPDDNAKTTDFGIRRKLSNQVVDGIRSLTKSANDLARTLQRVARTKQPKSSQLERLAKKALRNSKALDLEFRDLKRNIPLK
jgi:hypothetical protein